MLYLAHPTWLARCLQWRWDSLSQEGWLCSKLWGIAPGKRGTCLLPLRHFVCTYHPFLDSGFCFFRTLVITWCGTERLSTLDPEPLCPCCVCTFLGPELWTLFENSFLWVVLSPKAARASFVYVFYMCCVCIAEPNRSWTSWPRPFLFQLQVGTHRRCLRVGFLTSGSKEVNIWVQSSALQRLPYSLMRVLYLLMWWIPCWTPEHESTDHGYFIAMFITFMAQS